MQLYEKKQKIIQLNESNINVLRSQILTYFQQTYKLYESLFTCLASEKSFYLKANPLRHPLIFYYGHTATFYVNKLIFMNLIPKRLNEQYEAIFAIGVDEMSWDDMDNEHHDWPSVDQVQAYREKVYDLVIDFIKNMPLSSPIQHSDPAWIILMGIEHEHIHIETSAVLIRELPLQYVHSQKAWQPWEEFNKAPKNELLAVAGGEVELSKDTATFGWDNEYGLEKKQVLDFKASKFLVSNHEFLSFINANGYKQKHYWTEEGWQWSKSTKTTLPYFWRKRDEHYFLRVLTEEMPMPWDWPVEVNYFEAKAFCNFLSEQSGTSIRLPTEAEWHNFARNNLQNIYPSWHQPSANIDLAFNKSSCPVTKFKHGDFFDVIGNVWQWTETPIYAFEGFQVHAAYDDFSVPTFDNQHNVFKGGSWISCGNSALLESRYAFRKHFFQFAGIRYIESKHQPENKPMYYETDELMGQYLELHYGPTYFNEKNFMVNIVETVMQYFPEATQRFKALDLGCSVGRGCFELTKYFDSITGVDFSARFIQSADKLMQIGKVNYQIITEGKLFEKRNFCLSEIELKHQNIKFLQGDACNLHGHLTDFDLILAINLIDRLYDPSKFLRDIKTRMSPNAIIAISSPYTWLEEHTKAKNWLGGYRDSQGNAQSTFSGLNLMMEKDFELITDPINIPFVIRETARKFQHSISELTLWKMK